MSLFWDPQRPLSESEAGVTDVFARAAFCSRVAYFGADWSNESRQMAAASLSMRSKISAIDVCVFLCEICQRYCFDLKSVIFHSCRANFSRAFSGMFPKDPRAGLKRKQSKAVGNF